MHWALAILVGLAATQLSPRMASLVEAVRPVLPFPPSTPAGDLPIDNSDASRWFVVWPSGRDQTRIVVRANPLNAEVQEAGAAAMEEINAAVAAAERRAQASYDRALEQLRKTGKAGELETVTLDDEGAAGERIDAELEVTIELAAAVPFEVASGEAPVVQPGANGVAWVLTLPANTYRPSAGDDRRERFRAAETHLYFGLAAAPQVSRIGDENRYRVTLPSLSSAVAGGQQGAQHPAPSGGERPSSSAERAPSGAEPFRVVIRGNATLMSAVATGADWSRLAAR